MRSVNKELAKVKEINKELTKYNGEYELQLQSTKCELMTIQTLYKNLQKELDLRKKNVNEEL